MTHMMTLMDFTTLNGPISFSWQQMAPYLTWAMTLTPDSVNAHAAGIHTLLYSDPNRVNVNSPEYSNDEAEYAHDCTGSRITMLNKLLTTYLTDPTSTTLAGLWQQQVSNEEGGWGGVYDAVFEDSADVVGNVSAMPCNFDQVAWTANSLAQTSALGAPVIFNGLGTLVDGPTQISPDIALLPVSIGGELEGCYSNPDPNDPMPHSKVWATYENTEIQVVASGKLFLCRGLSELPDTTSQAYRIYMYASLLLTYSPSNTIISEKFTPANNGFGVEPENQLVAKDPIVSAPSDISQLMLGTGVYGRQYRNCYYAGNWVGPCAAVVNADSASYTHAYPYGNEYHHTLVLSGGDILDGGSASMHGPAPPPEMPGESAEIVFP
ncbi:MAG TPA: hypothetical protein VKT51_08955 [Candidatus Eremiobacteraceae bacterium]|nr:hypothetical protein [Candidatus Eremiobacteraceae bacterium]